MDVWRGAGAPNGMPPTYSREVPTALTNGTWRARPPLRARCGASSSDEALLRSRSSIVGVEKMLKAVVDLSISWSSPKAPGG